MHYQNGREAKNGDKIVILPDPKYGGAPKAGILYDAQAGNDFCNGRLAPISFNDATPNLKECLRLDDFNVLVALGRKALEAKAEEDAAKVAAAGGEPAEKTE